MGEVHRLLKEAGREAALRSDFDRRVVEAAAAYLASEDVEIGFLYSGWAQAALPHKRLPDDAPWQITTERVTLIVQPGLRAVPGGEPVSVGVPYGSRARLILLYLQSEALRTNSREIELGKSLHAWLRRLEIPIGGKSMKDVRDQAERLSRCRMTFTIKQGNRTGLVNQNLLDTSMFVEDDTTQGSLFIETATLSEMFFQQLKKHPVPIEETAVRQIANNSMALDVYCWLAYRLHALLEPMPISWRALHQQFGRAVKRLDHFKEQFKETLALALAVYPDAEVDMHERGVTLRPSRPPVAPSAPRLVAVGGRAARRTSNG
ncbi:replication protein RepA [Paracraurococcus ruber]|uniref:Plasmid replication initiator n=1 Tax=Paracraurococcus ruber TaxID=77675 RepID=A0ABS1D0M8_9PROT|nr:replication protein RepA [Paracraurococcus ruber]MBK1660208.1 plasmid replication initiator [Paracraurococcus ruber]TDG30157.1 plasmid replication initiator [Paracraurococcus ruber]